MMDTECVVLYTHQKLKKAKTWHDGVLKILTPGTRAILYDDKKNKIDTVHIKPEAIVCGEQLESDRHLILIEEIKSSIGHDQVPVSSGQSGGREQHVVQSRPHVPTTNSVGTGGRLSMRAGIKRRKTGFVPPRMIKQPRLDEDQSDVCDTGYNNPMVSSSPPVYTTNVQTNPDTAGILNLYSRTGVGKAIDSIPPLYNQSAEPSFTSSLQSNTVPLVATPPDHRSNNQSPLLGGIGSIESPGTVSHPPSPWSSFGAGRFKSLGSDSPRSKEGGSNERLQNGTRSSNHQNNYLRTTNFCERNTTLSEKDQDCYNKGSGSVINACNNSQGKFSNLPIADKNSGHNAQTKRSASQIMALLGRSRKRDGDERQSDIQHTEISIVNSGLVHVSCDSSVLPVSCDSSVLPVSCESSGLPVSQENLILPVSQDSSGLTVSQNDLVLPVSQDISVLPVSHDNSVLPVPHDSSVLPVSCDNSILPVSLPSQIECNLDKSDHHKPNDHKITATCVGINTYGKQIISNNDTRFVDSHKVMQHQAGVGTLYQTEMEDLSSDFDISLSSSSGTPNKKRDSIEITPVNVKEHAKLKQCSIEEEIWTKETDIENDIYMERIYHEQVSVQDGIDKEAILKDYQENDLLKKEKSLEGIASELKKEQNGHKGTVLGTCSTEDMGNKGTENDMAATYECNGKERPDPHLSEDDDNIVLGQQASFLISYSPLSQVSNSDDEDDVHSSHNIDEDPKPKTLDGEKQEDRVVERKDEWIDQNENLCKISSGEINIQPSDSSEGNFLHNCDVVTKRMALEDGGTPEKLFVERRDGWIDKYENVGKISSVETNTQFTDSSEVKHAEMREYQSSEDRNASQVPKTVENRPNLDALVDPNVSKEQIIGLNDLNFSQDSLCFASLPSLEGKEESKMSNASSWQTKEMLPGSHLVKDIPKFAVTSPKSTKQEFSEINVSSLYPTSQDNVLGSDMMQDVTDTTPESDGKYLLQCNDKSEEIRLETTPHECALSDISELDQEGLGKSCSLPCSGDLPSQCKNVSILHGSQESISQTRSVIMKVGRDTPPTGFVNTQYIENTSPDRVCHSSEKSSSRELPSTGMSYHHDNIPVRSTQEQHPFVESMKSRCMRPPAILEKCNMVEDHLPHPSQLLRRPNVTSNTTASTMDSVEEEDPYTDRVDPGPIENATQKLQQYKVRGSISGGVARRASKSASGLDYHLTRSPTQSAIGDTGTRESLFCSVSPSQSLESTSLTPDQEDHSLFIDWNVGKPQLVDMASLCNAQDIKIPGSPYQHVPIACDSPQSYGEGRNINDVPDIDFGRTKKHDGHITAESLKDCFSDKSSPGMFTTDFDLQSVPSESNRLLCKAESFNLERVPSESNRLLCEAESPTYGNMFKEKRNMTSCDSGDKINKFSSNLDKPIVMKKEKVSLKCKPFEDSFTHTSYSSSYFSPAKVASRENDSTSTNFRGQKGIPANVDAKHRKDTLSSVDIRGQREVSNTVDFRGQTDASKYVAHMYSSSELDIQEGNDNMSYREQSVIGKYPTGKNSDLHLSLSSVGSSDLELSFTLTEHCQGQSKASTDLPRDNNLYASSNIESGDFGSNTIKDFKPSQTCEDNVSCGTNEYNNSKWGKFMIKEDQDDDLMFDGSFDEQYNARKFDNRLSFKSVGESRRITPENLNQLECCNKSNNDMYNRSTINTENSQNSNRLSLSGQKTYTDIHVQDMQKHTMSSLTTIQMPTPAIPHTDSTVVPPANEEKENEISQDFLLDDFDMPETEDIISSNFSKQNYSKPDSHMVPPSVSTAVMKPVAEMHSRSPRSIVFKNTSTALPKGDVLLPGQNAMKKSPSLPQTPMAGCDILSQRQSSMKRFQSPVPSAGLVTHVMKGSKRNISGELQFASKEEVDSNPVPLREVSISVNFPTVAVYKQALTAVLKEHLNIVLFGLAQQYHHTMAMVDISNYSPAQHQGPLVNRSVSLNKASTNPNCQCGVPSKMIQVKKAGNNKGRFFYACNSARNKQCKYFQWVDQTGGGKTSTTGGNKLKLCEASSINTYMRGNHIMFNCECELLKKTASDITSHFKKGVPKWVKMKYEQTNQDKKKLYIKLSKKDASSLYSKDDLWIISTTLNFHPTQTFLAKSAYFGPNSASEVEIEPLAGFSPSNWPNHAFCHALLAGNISSELCYLSNIEDNLNPTSLPILPWILDSPNTSQRELSQQGGFKAPVRTAVLQSNMFATKTSIMELAEEFIQKYGLNTDQSSALMRVCHMFYGSEKGPETDPVLLIHGVFGAGKSFLLSVIVLFLVRLFEVSDSYTPGVPYPWKVLISSTTNVAVDRILLGLLEIGFEDFVRVGSMKKISKPVLPFSVHATGSESQELKDLQEMLRSGELTPSEKHNVRQSIEKHRLGENKKRLSKVRVVGVTCASCTASSLDKMTFPVVLLDESSQMTEPASMLPIAKFGCERLLLVGDPKQLDPTIQGSEAAHGNGLEQTLFDRLMKMGHTPTVLHTQYRCHPVISNLANTLFYNGQLIDGITSSDREPLVPEIPTLCFYDVSGGQEQADDGGSFYNEKEAVFVTSLIQELLVRGVEPASIGVITLYKSQMYKINTSLLTNVRSDGNNEIKATRVSTVDAFQGGEHDIIILSCVRTKGIGFIDNHKRTNVALTRARHHLLIVGKKSNLYQNQLWGQVLQLCSRQPGGVCEADTFLRQLEKDPVKSQDKMESTPCSPPMSLSSQEMYSVERSPQHDQENAVTGSESPPFTSPLDTVVSVRRRKSQTINADLLKCSEASDSDEDLPTF